MIRRLLARIAEYVPKGHTAERAIKSSLWLVGQNVAGRVLQLATLIVLGRLIGPEALGLVGIALLTLAGIREFTSIGITEALVQQEADDVDEYLSTGWILEAVRAVFISSVLFLGAPLVGSFFGEPRATSVIQVIAIAPIAMGLQNPGVVYFKKNLEYHREFVFRTSGAVTQFLVAIAWALVSPTVWAYVAAYLAGELTRFLVSYLIHDYRPSLRFDRAAAAEIIHYGKWITGSSIVYIIHSKGDDAFVGWLLGPAALAFYQYAYRFSNAPATEVTQVVSNVMFPTYSKLQNDIEQVQTAFIRSFRFTAFVATPMALGIAVVAPSFVRTFLGSSWVPMIPAMQLLAFFGLLRAIGKNVSPVWKALGRPDYVTKVGVLRTVLLAVTIYPATVAFGLEGTALAVLGVYLFPIVPIDFYLVSRLIDVSIARILQEAMYPFTAGALMFGLTWGVARWLTVSPPVEFVVVVLTGVVGYVAAVALVESVAGWGIRSDIEMVVEGIRA